LPAKAFFFWGGRPPPGGACGRAPVRRRGKSGLPATVLTLTSSPWIIRTTAKNRFDNQPARTAVANRERRRSARLQTRFTSFADHAANTSRAHRLARCAAAHSRSDGGVAGAERLGVPGHATTVKRMGRPQ